MSVSLPVEIRYPAAGETVHFRPVDPWVSWYLVHRLGGGVAPCLYQDCPDCHDRRRPGGMSWEGYLAGYPRGELYRPTILRLTPAVWWDCLVLGDARRDLRHYCLHVTRARLGGRASLTATLTEESDYVPVSVPTAPDLRDRLAAWWAADQLDARARTALYDLLAVQYPCRSAATLADVAAGLREEGVAG